jgi:hypothetical protein
MRNTQTEHGSRVSPESGLSALVAMALSGNQVMARAVVTPCPPMLHAIHTSSGSLTICRPRTFGVEIECLMPEGVTRGMLATKLRNAGLQANALDEKSRSARAAMLDVCALDTVPSCEKPIGWFKEYRRVHATGVGTIVRRAS